MMIGKTSVKEGFVTVRLFVKEDIVLKVRWINDPENNTFLHYDLPLNKEKTSSWFDNKDNYLRRDCTIVYNEIPVGVIGLLNIDYVNKKAEYYITLGEKKYKRKGIAKAATQIIIEYAFNDMGLEKVYLNVDADNLVACSLYEKVGFECEGLFKRDLLRNGILIDRKRYAVLKEKWVRNEE